MPKLKHTRSEYLSKDDSGVRTARLTHRASPVGYVAYCNPCAWSTGICVGMDDVGGLDRANIKLKNHRKTPEHHRNTRTR